MTMADDLTVEILKQIRDELKNNGAELREVRDETRANGVRLDRVVQEQIRHATAIVSLEAKIGDLAEGQRAVVSELVKMNARIDNVLTGQVGATVRDTAVRVDKLEERMSAVERR